MVKRNETQELRLGESESDYLGALDEMEEGSFVDRLWSRDAGLWKRQAGHRSIIRNSLGWLRAPAWVLERAEELCSFADKVRADGFQHVVVLGMGGSSLCPEVFRRTFGRREGYPELLVLDSTDPEAVRGIAQSLDPGRTLFILASKSGTTIEPLMFYRYFSRLVAREKARSAGAAFVAVTDPGTPLEDLGRQEGFRRVFINLADIGGRYSALSLFGMVPAALMGVEFKELLKRAVEASEWCRSTSARENPAARLGAALGALARTGRNKVTFLTPPPVDSVGLWVEQLLAESTGKEGQGILPVVGEPPGEPGVYGGDRVFVSIISGESTQDVEARITGLQRAGYPLLCRKMADPLDLGAEFFYWEFATALAGALLRINPFDQPNVRESKENTTALLDVHRLEGELPRQEPLLEEDGVSLYGDSETDVQSESGEATLSGFLGAHLSRLREGDYLALTAYLPEEERCDHWLQRIRGLIRDALKVSTTLGYGPRFLHSTGQLHKGGPDCGVFIQVTATERPDLSIPGESHTFGTLQQAQALGDYQALSRRGRRILRVDTGQDVEAGLIRLAGAVQEALGPIRVS